ncbi:hypothetical protein DFH09DRAFT_1374099 [Mycena vulgaris]|nr:hypothetical protein DFH09DRAFT_1374099 [Mycena vulgaris]
MLYPSPTPTAHCLLSWSLDSPAAPFGLYRMARAGKATGKDVRMWFGPRVATGKAGPAFFYSFGLDVASFPRGGIRRLGRFAYLHYHLVLQLSIILLALFSIIPLTPTLTSFSRIFVHGFPPRKSTPPPIHPPPPAPAPSSSINRPHAVVKRARMEGAGEKGEGEDEGKKERLGDRSFLCCWGYGWGLDGVNPIHYETIKLLYTFPQSVGIAGGRPSSSYHFVGAQGGGRFYLDRHHACPCGPSCHYAATHTARHRRRHRTPTPCAAARSVPATGTPAGVSSDNLGSSMDELEWFPFNQTWRTARINFW